MENIWLFVMIALMAAMTAGMFLLLWRTRRGPAAHAAAQDRHWDSLQKEADTLRQDNAALRERQKADQERITALEAGIGDRDERIRALGGELMTLKTGQAALQEREKSGKEQIKTLEDVRQTMQQTFKALAQDALEGNRQKFLTHASERLGQHMAPMKDILEKYQKSLTEMEQARKASEGALRNEMENVVKTQRSVGDQAAKLTHALRGSPTTRGRWGEQTLRNVMELAGMSEHCDFDTQQTMTGGESRQRPDAVIHMPGGHCMVVDAKTSLNAYMDSVEESDEAARDRHLKAHARAVREHMTGLAAKSYWESLARTPDFVVMFMPGENFYAAAVQHDPSLFEDAIARKVLITSPTTFIALARAVAYGWRQDAAAREAQGISAMGRELYKRLRDMGEHIVRLGRSLDGAVNQYNRFIGSLESRVLSQARRFDSDSLTARDKHLPAPDPVETAVREPASGRDLRLPPPGGGS